MKLRKVSFLFCFLILIVFKKELYPQSLSNIHYTTADGLPSQVVYSLIQDKEGFIWFGTQNGLCRFDGKNFKVFTTDDGLPDNEVLQLYQDKMGRIWLSLFNGGACYFFNNTFHTQKNDSLLACVKGIKNFVNYFFPENEDWFVIYGGKKIYTLSSQLNIIACYNENLFSRVSGFPDPAKNELFISGKTLEFKKGKIVNTVFVPWTLPNKVPYSTAQLFFNRMYSIKEKGEKLEVRIFDATTKKIKETRILDFDYKINRIFKIEEYIYLTGYEAELIRYSEKDTFLQYPEILMVGKVFNHIIKDNEGGFWISSLDDGVYHVPAINSWTFNVSNGLQDNGIYSIFEFKSGIYFTDFKGNLYRHSPFQKFKIESGRKFISRILNCSVDQQSVYMGTDEGIYEYNFINKTISPPIIVTSVKDISKVGNQIYFSSIGGLIKYDLISGRFDTISPGRKTTHVLDKKKNIWFGELNGLYRINQDNQEFDYGEIYPVLRTRITSLRISNDEVVWIATQANGLIGIKNDSLWIVISKQDGLITNNLKSIYVNNGNVYIATDKGVDIVNYSLQTGHYLIRHVGKFDGLADDDVNSVYFREDTLYAGTAAGFSIIPLNNKRKQILPRVYISSFSVNGMEISFKQPIELYHNKNNIVITYTGISYSSGNNILYRYRFRKDENWKFTSSTTLTFPNLSPGVFSFEVAARNSSGQWSMSPAIIDFTINKPFWMNTWFLFSLIVLSIAIVIAVIYIRKKKYDARLKSKMEIQRKIAQLELDAIRAQMNPHFIFNALNSIQDFVFKHQREIANDYLSSFSRLMRIVLNRSRLDFVTITHECDFLKLYLKLEKLRLNESFDYHIEIDQDIEADITKIPGMTLQPLVENAIIHGVGKKKKGGMIGIKIKKKAKDIEITVEDNGAGRSEPNEKMDDNDHSFGLRAIEERIKIYNSMQPNTVHFCLTDLKNELGVPSGTQAVLTLREIK